VKGEKEERCMTANRKEEEEKEENVTFFTKIITF